MLNKDNSGRDNQCYEQYIPGPKTGRRQNRCGNDRNIYQLDPLYGLENSHLTLKSILEAISKIGFWFKVATGPSF
jgi:hypothetical protein